MIAIGFYVLSVLLWPFILLRFTYLEGLLNKQQGFPAHFTESWDPLPAYYLVLGTLLPITVFLALTHQELFGLGFFGPASSHFCCTSALAYGSS